MEIKKENDINVKPQAVKEENKKLRIFFAWGEGLLKKKYSAWIIAAVAVFIFGTAYLFVRFGKADKESFAGKFLKPFLAEKLPFVERNSFRFPPNREEKTIPEENGEKTVLNESSERAKSASPDWWLNSGGIMNIGSQEFSTNIGPLEKDFYWRKLYAKTNPKDTDEGYSPQNIFRLVTKDKWKNFSQSVYFKIENINLSQSKNRNESNGILLFNRYQDGDNLYYTGIRVDGGAVIKKKIKDKYYTLKEKKIFTGNDDYDKEKNPNLIPSDSWIGIKSEVKNIDNDTVDIKLYIDREQKGQWQLVLESKDSTDKKGAAPFLQEGYAGIRTDFMDVRFRSYSIQGP